METDMATTENTENMDNTEDIAASQASQEPTTTPLLFTDVVSWDLFAKPGENPCKRPPHSLEKSQNPKAKEKEAPFLKSFINTIKMAGKERKALKSAVSKVTFFELCALCFHYH